MALNVSESVAVNRVLEFLLQKWEAPGEPTAESPEEALTAAMMLARVARKTLDAGITPADVHRRWKALRERELK